MRFLESTDRRSDFCIWLFSSIQAVRQDANHYTSPNGVTYYGLCIHPDVLRDVDNQKLSRQRAKREALLATYPESQTTFSRLLDVHSTTKLS